MTVRRPVVLVGGNPAEMPAGDTVDPATLPASSGALVDGGDPTTVHSGNLKVDFGSPT